MIKSLHNILTAVNQFCLMFIRHVARCSKLHNSGSTVRHNFPLVSPCRVHLRAYTADPVLISNTR